MKKLLPLTFLLLFVSFCLLSFKKRVITVVVEGKVMVADKPLPGVYVFLEKEGLPENKKSYAATVADGSFTFQLNAHENEKIFLHFQKEGYLPFSKEYFPQSDKLRKEFSTITLQPEVKVSVLTKATVEAL